MVTIIRVVGINRVVRVVGLFGGSLKLGLLKLLGRLGLLLGLLG